MHRRFENFKLKELVKTERKRADGEHNHGCVHSQVIRIVSEVVLVRKRKQQVWAEQNRNRRQQYNSERKQWRVVQQQSRHTRFKEEKDHSFKAPDVQIYEQSWCTSAMKSKVNDITTVSHSKPTRLGVPNMCPPGNKNQWPENFAINLCELHTRSTHRSFTILPMPEKIQDAPRVALSPLCRTPRIANTTNKILL